MHSISRWLLVSAIAFLCVGGVLADIESEARKIETLLMAPCCGANTVAMHDSGAAHEMKREIREMLASGMTRQQILEHYVAIHGNTILSMPPARGFSLVVYVLPLLALILGPLFVWRWLRRGISAQSSTPVQSSAPEPSSAPARSSTPADEDSQYRKRLEERLRNY